MSPKVFVFGSSESLYGDYSGISTVWNPTGLKTKPVFDINPDSKNKTILFEEQEENIISEVKLNDLSKTDFSISGIEDSSSVQVDAIRGDVYILNKCVVTPENNRFFGGILYRQKRDESSPTELSVLNGTSELRFFRPQDMKIDSPRRKLWIADTGNHRLVSVNLETLSASLFEFENLTFCCGVSINPTNGTVLSRWFDSETLEERIVSIDKNGINSSYSSFSDFPWGDLSSNYGNGDLLLIESVGNNKGIYRISANGSSRVLIYKSNYKTPVAISVEPIYGMISVLYANGTVAGFSNIAEFFQENNFAPDSKGILFPSFYGLGHWSGNYKGYFNSHFPVNTRIEPAYITEIQKSSTIHGLEAGVCSFSNMKPSFLTNNGLKMVTFSKDCKTIANETVFDFEHRKHGIAQDAKNGDLFTYSSVLNLIERYDKNHNKISEIPIPSTKIIFIDAKHNGSGGVWALTDNNEIYGVENDEIISYLQIPSLNPLKSIKHDMSTGGAWTNSKDTIYKISSNGQTLVFSKSGFKNINGIAPQNYLADLYNSDEPFALSRSMVFDGVRNQVWWISNPKKHLVGMIDFTSNTGGVLSISSLLQSSSSFSTNILSSSMDNIYSIDIDLQTGEAFIGLVDIDGNTEIVRIDRSCSEIIDGSIMPFQDVPGLIYIEQNSQGILPFSIEIATATRTNNDEFDFSIVGVEETEVFNPSEFFVEKTEVTGLFDSSEEEIEVNSPFTKIQVWVDENEGVKGTLVGVIPGLSHEEIRIPTETTRLPVFSWTSSGVVTNLLLFVGRDDGRIDMYAVNPSDLNRRADVFELKKSLLGKNTPLRENPINSFGINIDSQNIFISSKRGVLLSDSKSLQPLSYVKTAQDFKAQIQEPKGVLWGVSRLEGSLQKITRTLDKNKIHDESSEILTTSSSQSDTSSSISSLSSVSSSSLSSLNSSSSSVSSVNSSSSSIQSSSSISSQSPHTEIVITDIWGDPLEIELSQSEYNTLYTPYTGSWPWVLTVLPLTFPPTRVGSSSFANLVFRNAGSTSIKIRRIVAYPPFFTTGFALVDVPPGGTIGTEMEFRPPAEGEYSSDVLVDSSIFATGTLQGFNSSMHGQGIPADGSPPIPVPGDPMIYISPVWLDRKTIDFGVVPKGSSKTESVKLINRDNIAHYCKSIWWDTAKGISCHLLPETRLDGVKWDSESGFWLEAGGERTVSVTFRSTEEDAYILGDILVYMETGTWPPGWPLRCTVIGTSWPSEGDPE